MFLSQTHKSELNALTAEQKTAIVYGSADYSKLDEICDFALLLGSHPDFWRERSAAAARLYLEGKVKYVVPSGGVEWEYMGRRITEALCMTEMLIEMGVPSEAILIENEARTTVENMLLGAVQINRKREIYGASGLKVVIVTSPRHIKRSVALAKLLLPRCYKIFGFVSDTDFATAYNWHEDPRSQKYINTEVSLLKALVDGGMMDDIEY